MEATQSRRREQQLAEENEKVVRAAAELTAIRQDKGQREAERTAARRFAEIWPAEEPASSEAEAGEIAFDAIMEEAGAIITAGGPLHYAAQQAWQESEEARGELAGAPEQLWCAECSRKQGENVHQRVAALGPVVGQADPTQSYKLACGHMEIG